MLSVAILAGGLATRLRPITEKIPKSLLPVAGRPFVAWQLEQLRKQGASRVVLCIGHLGEQIEATVGDGAAFGLEVAYSRDGTSLRGTGGALRQALPLLGDAFFVLYGDSYLPCDYRAIESAFRRSGQPALMTVFRNENRWDRSNVEYAGNRVIRYDKRNPDARMHYIDYGLGALKSETLASRAEGAAFDLADVYSELIREGRLAGYEVAERFYEAGSSKGMAELERYLTSHQRT